MFATYRDALLELADAVLCKQDRVHMLAELSLEPEHRRGHGALYGAVNCGRIDIARLRWSLACLPLPAWGDGRIRLAADVSNWLRPDAATSPDRLFCHCYARGKGNAQMIPGWPYSLVVALEPGRTSWTLPLDAVRLGPADDATAVTAAQVREVVSRIIATGHWRDGDPDILVVFDAGYDLTRLAWLLADLPVEVLGRLRSDRVMYFPVGFPIGKDPYSSATGTRFKARCLCGQLGHVNTLAPPRRIVEAFGGGTLEQISQISTGDPEFQRAQQVFKHGGAALGRALAHVSNTVNPSRVIMYLPAALADPEPDTAATAYLGAVRQELSYAFAASDQPGYLRIRAFPANPQDFALLGAQAAAVCVLESFIEHALRLDGCKIGPRRSTTSSQGPAE